MFVTSSTVVLWTIINTAAFKGSLEQGKLKVDNPSLLLLDAASVELYLEV